MDKENVQTEVRTKKKGFEDTRSVLYTFHVHGMCMAKGKECYGKNNFIFVEKCLFQVYTWNEIVGIFL